ncbi:TRAP transporter small permease [Candidatus Symbiobacter mobilis]|uniref:TRAP transporter small permease protein n=1 Tax=Candidatus Symbiobacter mobilis CR TaxID=946483 RepID=U5NDZ3_9BURK|nr:TRAP transporter small permease [Candidatus Symbiobacter mobilis]AGX88438.1 hypothetical protein Cenrod_2379 [Candidatus Symbiobacter mobilis CR]
MHTDLSPSFDAIPQAARALALLGALGFLALAVLSVVSVVGRKLAAAPIPGDIELVQMGAAVAASWFFPYCTLRGADLKIDIVPRRWRAGCMHWLDTVASLGIAAFGALVGWRVAVGAWGLYEAGETSMVLGCPLWIPQMLLVPGFVLMGVCGLHRAAGHWQQVCKR